MRATNTRSCPAEAAMVQTGRDPTEVCPHTAQERQASSDGGGETDMHVVGAQIVGLMRCGDTDTEEARRHRHIVALMRRGYTDAQIIKHHTLVEQHLSPPLLASIREETGGVRAGMWIGGVGRMAPAFRL